MTLQTTRYLASASLSLLVLFACCATPAQQISQTDLANGTVAAIYDQPIGVSSSLNTGTSSTSSPGGGDSPASSLTPSLAAAEDGDQTAVPNAPAPQTTSQGDQHTDQQTKRILGIIPNFRSVSTNVKLPRETVKEKFVDATEDSFDYSSFVLPAFIAGYDMARRETPEFHNGGVGYGRYYWHSLTDQTIENYMVEFIVPVAAHEDTRYYTLGNGGFVKRATYSLSRVLITRSDDGKRVFNAGEVLGSGMAAGISNLYYPEASRTFGNTASQWGLDVGIDAASYMFREFWPDINHYLFHGDKTYNNNAHP